MSAVLQQVTVLLTSILKLSAVDPECPMGWFGDNCRYKCRCSNTVACKDNGDCFDNAGCSTGYFGPACQYVDLASVYGSNDTPFYLTDGDEFTCNNRPHETILEMFLTKAAPFFWLRLHVNNMKHLFNFTLELNNMKTCSNQRRFRVSVTAVDVTCDTNVLLHKLVIRGAIVGYICSIYISGGRNVALKQEASQSSDGKPDMEQNKASNAVDGKTTKDHLLATCSCTDIEYAPEWVLRFNRPQVIIAVIVHNRYGFLSKLHGFTVETFNQEGNRTNYFKDFSIFPLFVYEIYLSTIIPISTISIKASPDIPIENRLLTLCEVEALGETICTDGFYGLWCSGQCRCSAKEVCNTVTGACLVGCSDGMYGFNCSSQCSKNCYGGTCLQRMGTCPRCLSGFAGTYCDNACVSGYFGLDCMFNCSVHCATVCDSQTGYCSCKEGYSGLQCTECRASKYGTMCTMSCPRMCLDSICHIQTGNCVACVGNRVGDDCEDCPPKMYGAQCYSICSEYCLNGTCDQIAGNCSVCTHDYSGGNCRVAPRETFSWMYYIMPLTAMMVTLLILSLCWLALHKYSGKRFSNVSEEEDKASDITEKKSQIWDRANQSDSTSVGTSRIS